MPERQQTLKQEYVAYAGALFRQFRSLWPIMFLHRSWPACRGPMHGSMQGKSTRPTLTEFLSLAPVVLRIERRCLLPLLTFVCGTSRASTGLAWHV